MIPVTLFPAAMDCPSLALCCCTSSDCANAPPVAFCDSESPVWLCSDHVTFPIVCLSSEQSMSPRFWRSAVAVVLCHNICAILCISFFVLPLLWRFCADLNLCSAFNQISPKTLSSSDDFLFVVACSGAN
jgi:hypothetical protein